MMFKNLIKCINNKQFNLSLFQNIVINCIDNEVLLVLSMIILNQFICLRCSNNVVFIFLLCI